jgi:multidrug efflux system membrane fusion protein
MKSVSLRKKLWGAAIVAALAAGGTAALVAPSHSLRADNVAAPAPATPVSVSVVEKRDLATWNEFSGRLEAVERVEIRSRVAGALLSAHFREGALVNAGDLLLTIDPEPYAADVDRSRAQVAAAEARVLLTKGERERGQSLLASGTISSRELDVRINAHNEAEAALRAAQAVLKYSRLNLSYTEVRAPVAGRVGKLEVTVGNLIPAGPGAPALTTLVSVSPIYASFEADEKAVMDALKTLPAGPGGRTEIERIPVQMGTSASDGTPFTGRLQLIDNVVDVRSGTMRVRAVFDNADGALIPGQFARLRMGAARSNAAIVVNERAIGTNQDKKFVMVVGADNKVAYREIELGGPADGLRIVTHGLAAGERVVVNGLQRIRPGDSVTPEVVSMDTGLRSVAQR